MTLGRPSSAHVIFLQVFTTLRVYALSGKNKILTGIVMLLSTGPFIVNACTLYQDVPINLPAPDGCTINIVTTVAGYIASVIASRTCSILADILAVIVTWRRTNTARKASTRVLRRSSLEQILWENGNIYFCVLVSLNTVNMTLVVFTVLREPSEIFNYLLTFIDPIISILNSRFLLALYKTNAQLEGGGASASSIATLEFGGADDEARSQELPEFLTSLAGPIRSFPDDNDPERFDSDTTLQIEREEVVGAHLEGEGEESAGEVGDSERV